MVSNADPSRVRSIRAFRRGRRTKEQGLPVDVCPYDANGSLAQRFYAMAWVRGYNSAEEPETPKSA